MHIAFCGRHILAAVALRASVAVWSNVKKLRLHGYRKRCLKVLWKVTGLKIADHQP